MRTSRIKAYQRAFTLIEMVGVMAVIGILAAAAAPKVFEAIQDAKVTAYLQQVNTLKSAATAHYMDTGRFPRHIPTHADSRYHDLMTNDSNGSGLAVKGWNGPYLEAELDNQFSPGGYQDLIVTDSTNYNCDIDGNGTRDGKFVVLRTDGVSDNFAEKISNIIDGDGGVTAGNGSWKAAGRVKRYGANSDHASIMVHCISGV